MDRARYPLASSSTRTRTRTRTRRRREAEGSGRDARRALARAAALRAVPRARVGRPRSTLPRSRRRREGWWRRRGTARGDGEKDARGDGDGRARRQRRNAAGAAAARSAFCFARNGARSTTRVSADPSTAEAWIGTATLRAMRGDAAEAAGAVAPRRRYQRRRRGDADAPPRRWSCFAYVSERGVGDGSDPGASARRRVRASPRRRPRRWTRRRRWRRV